MENKEKESMNAEEKNVDEEVLEEVSGGVPYNNDPTKHKPTGIHMGGGYN